MDHFGLIPHIRQIKHHDFARNWLHPTSQPLNFAQGTDLPEKTGAQGSIVLPTVCTGDGPEKMAILTWIHGGFPGPIPAFRDLWSRFLRIWAVWNCPIWVRKRWHDSDDLWKIMKKSNNSKYTDYTGKNIYKTHVKPIWSSISKASGMEAETLGTSDLTTMGHSNFVSTGVVGRVLGRLRGVTGRLVRGVTGLPVRCGVRSVSKPSRSKPVISKGVAVGVLGENGGSPNLRKRDYVRAETC